MLFVGDCFNISVLFGDRGCQGIGFTNWIWRILEIDGAQLLLSHVFTGRAFLLEPNTNTDTDCTEFYFFDQIQTGGQQSDTDFIFEVRWNQSSPIGSRSDTYLYLHSSVWSADCLSNKIWFIPRECAFWCEDAFQTVSLFLSISGACIGWHILLLVW